MNLRHHIFGYDWHTSLTVRADKMNQIAMFNRPVPTGLIPFVPEDEP